MSEKLIASKVTEYLNSLVPPREPELQKMEDYGREHSFPIIGPSVGNLCYLIAKLIKARSVFEMGSGYGYSTAWFARAVMENGGGVVHHVVWDKALSSQARQHLSALGYGEVVKYTVGEAVQALRDQAGSFDLIFNDIDKHAYPESLEVISERLKPGGVLMVDNMLMSGRIFESSNKSAGVEGVKVMTNRIAQSPNWISAIVPIRDGVLLATKQG